LGSECPEADKTGALVPGMSSLEGKMRAMVMPTIGASAVPIASTDLFAQGTVRFRTVALQK